MSGDAGAEGDGGLGREGIAQAVGHPTGVDGALGRGEARDDVGAREAGELVRGEAAGAGGGGVGEVAGGVGMGANQGADAVEGGGDGLRRHDGVAVDEQDVVAGGDVRGEVGGDQFAQQRPEAQAARDEPASGGERGVGAVEEAEVDLALVPAAGAGKRRRGAVEEVDPRAATGEEEREARAHDAGAEDGDAPAHPAAAGSQM